MVIDDNPLPETQPEVPAHEPLSLEDRLANPMDRLAAVVADFVIVSPLATLAMSPFKRMAEEAQLQGSDDRWFIATVSGIGISVLLVIAYQVIFLVKWRATPGKRLMGLTVESLWQDEGSPMRAQAAFVRSLAWCAEAALGGFPWIAVVGNERRRPFHDRLADTVVLSKKRSMGPPGIHEMSLASGLVGAFFTSLLIVVAMRFGHYSSASSVLDDGGDTVAGTCEQVDRAEKSWVEGLGEKKPSRMSIALSLYEAESIDEDCLKQEADVALWKSGAKDLAYLARGLAEKSDDELSQKYLDKSCSGTAETDACRALALLNQDELPDDPIEAKSAQVERDNEVLQLINGLTPQSEPFLRILAIRELTTRHQHTQALALIDSFPPQKDLSFFLSSERMKTLWALNRKAEARLSMTAAISGYESDQRVSLARWFCQTETSESGCSAQAKPACDLLAANVDHDHVLLGDPEVTLTYIRGETCAQRLTAEKLKDLKQEMPDAASQAYVEALAALEKDAAEGTKQLKSIAEKDNAFSNEAWVKLTELAKNEKDLTPVREAWADADSTADGWAYLGRRLMARYNDFKAWDQTIEIGFKMGEGEPLDQASAKSFIVAAYRSGQTKMALSYLQTYFDKAQEDSLRAPASEDGFEEIAREIRTDFDNGVVQRKHDRAPQGLPTKLPAKRKKAR